MKVIKTTLLFTSLLIFSCQGNKSNLFDIEIDNKDGNEKMTYYPDLSFEEVKDSAEYLFDEKDHYRKLSSDIKVTPPIFQNDIFKVRVFMRSVFINNKYDHGFLIRTYSKDGKIKDEIVLASTLGDLSCKGEVTSDLRIITNCPDGDQIIAQIEKDGSIKIMNDE